MGAWIKYRLVGVFMKKIINIIKYIPFLNLLSFILFAIPIPLIYGFDRKKYFLTFFMLMFGALIYVLLLKFVSIISIYWINVLMKYILVYILGLYFCKCVEKYV